MDKEELVKLSPAELTDMGICPICTAFVGANIDVVDPVAFATGLLVE